MLTRGSMGANIVWFRYLELLRPVGLISEA